MQTPLVLSSVSRLSCLTGISAAVCLTTSLLFSTQVTGQEYDAIDGGEIPIGGFNLFPILNVDHYFDSNVIRSATDDVDGWVRVVAPELILVNEYDAHRLQIGYRLADGHYYSSSIDNYTDHFLSARIDLYANERHRFELASAYELGHDARGTVFSIGSGGTLATPDEYKQTQFDGTYFFGATDATGRLELNLNHTSLDYDINTPQYLVRDRSFNSIGGTFYYRVAPATDALIEVRSTQIDYDFDADSANPFDSTVNSVLVGVRWESTRNTSGFAKVGFEQKNFDSDIRGDFSGADWNLGVDWTPIDRAFFRLATSRNTFETNGEGNFIDNRAVALTWRHSWLERVRSEVIMQVGYNSYEGNIDSFAIRNDDIGGLSATLDYDFRRWWRFQIGYAFEKRESNRFAIDYDRHVFNINMRVTL